MATPIGTYSGLVSGMDFYALADQIIAIERLPAVRLEQKIAQANQRKTALDGYRTALAGLKDAAADFADGSAIGAFSTIVSNALGSNNQTLLSAKAEKGATPGVYTVRVTALAGAQKNVGTAQAGSTAALGLDGTVDIAGQQLTITAADSLTAIRDRINALNTGGTATGVTASILKVADGDHRLVLTADETGTANGFTVTDVAGTAAQTLGLNNVSTAAADSAFTIDGVAMTRSGNVVTDALDGVTLTLQNADANKDIGVEVKRHSGYARDSAKAFVDAFNAVADFVAKQSQVGAPLYRDATVRANQSTLVNNVLASATGGALDLETLGKAGIEITRDGKLSLDSTKFEAAFNERFEDLGTLLAERGAALESYIDQQTKAGSGMLALKEQSITESVASMEDRILNIDSRLERRREALIRRYTAFEVQIGRMQDLQKQMQTQFDGLKPRDD